MGDIYFWRQVLVLTTSLFYALSTGFMLAFPSVLNPAILSPNSTDSDIHATSNQASWISASNGIASLFGLFFLSPIMQIYGRKITHICTTVCLLIGWITFSFAHTITALFAARIIQGLAHGAVYIHCMIISEYCDPKRRGYFITLTKLAIALGILKCHASSLIWNWRQIAIFAIVPSIIPLVLALFWPESPAFLAMRGRFEDSEKSFVWLHGGSNMHELHVLLNSQQEKQRNPSPKKWYKFLFKKNFVKPLLIVFLLTLLIDLCGRHYIMVYVIEIMVVLIGDKSIAIYCSLGSDALTIVALLTSCFVIKLFKRRTLLLSFGIAIVAMMLLISLIIYLNLSSVRWLTPILILLHVFTVNIGLIPICFTFAGEVFPLEHKGTGSFMTGVIFTILYTVSLKLTPILMESTGVEGVYAIYGLSIGICLVALYFVVPETMDRTLQDIEDEYKDFKPACDKITTTVTNNV